MFIISIVLALIYFLCSLLISINWINDIACYFGYFLAIYLVTFVALIPGFNYAFTFFSLLFQKKEKQKCIQQEKDVTVLIPVYNCKDHIQETIKSIQCQEYCGDISIIMINDGSTDGSLEILKDIEQKYPNVTLIESAHISKSAALNKGLECVHTEYVITVDSDTVLHPLAIRNIMKKLTHSHSKTVATAGCIFTKSTKRNFVAKLQEWDYTLGIFGVKMVQSMYHSTLVAQGAFSAYQTCALKEIGGWKNCVGEDIVLTWQLLAKGYHVNFAQNAIAFTEIPTTYKTLGKQRKRWARGMIEAFKETKAIFSKKLSFPARILMFLNLFFPFIDLALLIFVPLGLILLAFKNPLLISWISLLVIPLSLLLCLLIELKRNACLKSIQCKLEKRSKLAFLFYILLYTFFLTPFCLIGYICELFHFKKAW